MIFSHFIIIFAVSFKKFIETTLKKSDLRHFCCKISHKWIV